MHPRAIGDRRVAITTLLVLGVLASSIAPALAQSAGLPNLFVDAEQLARSLVRRAQHIKSGSCVIEEGCVAGPGKRSLLRFDTVIGNDGDADLVLGSPVASPDLFEFSPCHHHYHLKSFTDFQLVTLDGVEVVRGRKQAFCLLDSVQLDPLAGPGQYSCGFQGISAGWGDIYPSHLDCQWIDVTGVPPGDYLLRVTVDPLDVIAEVDESDNVAEVPVTLRGRRVGRDR